MNQRNRRDHLMRCALAAVLLLALGGCKSSADYAAEADKQVYELIERRRSKLSAEAEAFTIEPKHDSLRQRLLRGEADAQVRRSLTECLEIAAENSREYQRRRETVYLVALDLTLERWNFNVHESGVLTASVLGTGDEAQTAEGDAKLKLSKLLGSGALIVGDIGLNLFRTLTSADDWNPVGDLGLAVTQPLLRGFGRKIVEEPLTQAERNLVYEVRSFERFRRTFAVDVASRYYRLLQVMDSVSNQETNVANLARLSERNQALTEAGRLSDVEAGQARQNELSSRNQLLDARERLERDRDLFKLFLGLPIESELMLDPAELEALIQREFAADLDQQRVIAFALENRLDYLVALDQEVDGRRHVEVAADALRTRLDVGAGVTSVSPSGKPLKHTLDDADWTLSATLELPFDRLPQRNAYRARLIAFEAARRLREQTADTIRADLRDELRLTNTRRESYRIQLNAVDLAQRRIESTRLKLDAGRAETRDLLEAQASLLQAQNAATTALIDYTLAQLDLFRDMEILRVDQAGIGMDESLWNAALALDPTGDRDGEPSIEEIP